MATTHDYDAPLEASAATKRSPTTTHNNSIDSAQEDDDNNDAPSEPTTTTTTPHQSPATTPSMYPKRLTPRATSPTDIEPMETRSWGLPTLGSTDDDGAARMTTEQNV